MKFCIISIMTLVMAVISTPVIAKCNVEDKLCVMKEIRETADEVTDKGFRDTLLQDLAKSYVQEGYESKAVALVSDVHSNQNKANIIRIIGITAAKDKWKTKENKRDRKRYATLFEKLSVEAKKIESPSLNSIAHTYIAMGQASAKDYKGAMLTASAMENAPLRHKAYAEIAEIQAGQREFDATMASIAKIESGSFRNKIYGNVARIFTKKGELESAYNAANKIDTPYMRAQVLQRIIAREDDKK